MFKYPKNFQILIIRPRTHDLGTIEEIKALVVAHAHPLSGGEEAEGMRLRNKGSASGSGSLDFKVLGLGLTDLHSLVGKLEVQRALRA